jgi:hypothetical protein
VELEEAVAGAMSCHSALQAARPRRWNLVIPRRNLARANTVSMMCWRFRYRVARETQAFLGLPLCMESGSPIWLPPRLRRVSFLASSSDFVVESNLGFYALAWLLVASVAAVITALKGRWGWLLAGCIFGGLLWLVSAWLAPRPGSWWARRRGSHRQPSPQL